MLLFFLLLQLKALTSHDDYIACYFIITLCYWHLFAAIGRITVYLKCANKCHLDNPRADRKEKVKSKSLLLTSLLLTGGEEEETKALHGPDRDKRFASENISPSPHVPERSRET